MKKYLIKENESKENLLLILDCENEYKNGYENEKIELSIEKEDVDRKWFPVAIYLNNYWYDICTLDFIKRSLVKSDINIIDLLENDLKENDNKKYVINGDL